MLTIKTDEAMRHFDVFIINFEHISHFALVFQLLKCFVAICNTRWSISFLSPVPSALY